VCTCSLVFDHAPATKSPHSDGCDYCFVGRLVQQLAKYFCSYTAARTSAACSCTTPYVIMVSCERLYHDLRGFVAAPTQHCCCGAFQDTDEYSPLCGLPLPQWFAFTACAAQGPSSSGDIYLVGGSTCGKWSKVLYRFKTDPDPKKKGEPNEVEYKKELSSREKRRRAGHLGTNNSKHHGGGGPKGSYWDAETSWRWERLPDMTLPRRRLAAAAIVL